MVLIVKLIQSFVLNSLGEHLINSTAEYYIYNRPGQAGISSSLLTDILSPEEDQAQHSLLLPLNSFGGLRLQFSELLAIPEDDVHVFVKSFELTNERSRVLQDDSHPVVDVALHLVVLPDNHPACSVCLSLRSPVRHSTIHF